MAHRVLVVEDEAWLREAIATIIASAGHEVETAEHGEAGLEAVARQRPDLVVLDLITPRLHGYEVIQRLRSQDRTRRLPILVLSAKMYPTDQRKALSMGANAFLPKPFETEVLLAQVQRLLQRTRVTFWGVRGSIATPGAETVRYGGNTPCVTLEHEDDTLILDAGTGVRRLGTTLQAEADGGPLDLKMLITHTHWDHIQGFPFFVPAYREGNKLSIYGPPSPGKPLEKVLRGQMDSEYFPVALGDMSAQIAVHEIRDRYFDIGRFSVEARLVNHPGITMAFRVKLGEVVVTYATDLEPLGRLLAGKATDAGSTDRFTRLQDAELVELAQDADLYIADSQYSPEEYEEKRGWGHSNYLDAVDIAVRAGVRRLALFSHDPMHDDDAVDRKVARCREAAEEAGSAVEIFAAAEGQVVDLAKG